MFTSLQRSPTPQSTTVCAVSHIFDVASHFLFLQNEGWTGISLPEAHRRARRGGKAANDMGLTNASFQALSTISYPTPRAHPSKQKSGLKTGANLFHSANIHQAAITQILLRVACVYALMVTKTHDRRSGIHSTKSTQSSPPGALTEQHKEGL